MTKLQRRLLRGPVPWLEKERNRISGGAGRDSNRIRRALEQCGVELSGTTDRIPTDLGDMLEAFRHIKLSLERLASRGRGRTRRFARDLLEQIRNDIYIHLDYHFRGLRRPLDRLIDDLEKQVGSRWDRVVKDFEGGESRGGGATGDSRKMRVAAKNETFSSILASSRTGR